MSVDTVLLREIGVHRMPGTPRGRGFVISELQPGVNVVFGPNGCGKTTTARAVEEILWPGQDPELQPSLTASLILEGATWRAEIEGLSVTWHRDGAGTTAPDFGAPDIRHRYRLSLAEMITASDTDESFAAQVSRAMIGGFDLDAVAATGNYGKRPVGVGNRRDAAQETGRDLEAAMRVERELERRRLHELPELRRGLDKARRAVSLELACNRALEYRQASDEIRRLQRARDTLPLDRVRSCHDNDRETLAALERRRKEIKQQREELRNKIDEADGRLGERAIPENGIPEHELDRLKNLAAELRTGERHRSELQRERPRVQAERDQCLGRLERELTSEQIDTLNDVVAADEAESFAREAHRLAGQAAALRERRLLLPDRETLNDAADPAGLERWHQVLAGWLAVPSRKDGVSRRLRFATWIIATLGAALSVVLAFVHHPLWLGAIGAVVVTAWLGFRSRASGARDAESRREAFRQEFQRLDLPGPDGWTTDRVAERIRSLADEIVRARSDALQREQHLALDRRERDLDRLRRDHERRREELETRVGADLPREDAWLPVFTQSIRRWHEAHDRLKGIDAEISSHASRIKRLMDQVEQLVAPYGEIRADSADTVDAIRDRLRDLERVARDRGVSRTELSDRVEPGLAEANAARASFFAERGLIEGDTPGLDVLLEQGVGLQKLEQRLQQAEGAAAAAGSFLSDHPGLLEQSVAELTAKRDDCTETASRHDELVAKIALIEQAIDQARTGNSVADFRAALIDAIDALRADRLTEGRRAVGEMLLGHIGSRSREMSVPEVFERARRLFVRITAGRFELRPPVPGGDCFRAYDCVDSIEKTVDRLSTGERVQLLLAVRLGFLEHGEHYRLPLLLDETLATSDDDRVREIMNALVELAGDGRQIVYFTAQHDEVGKWKACLAGKDVPLHLVDLAAVRSGERARLTPLEIRPIDVARLPAPNEHCHAEYGRLIDAPGLDPFRMRPPAVHLWHVIDDTRQLHALLSRNIETIGQFLTYQRYGGKLPEGVEERTGRWIEAAARGLEGLFDAWRQGRAAPVDLQQLLDTRAVSDVFRPRIAPLLEEVGHDPVALLSALDSGLLPHWHRTNTDAIRDAFRAGGILNDGERLRGRELEIRLNAVLSRETGSGPVDPTWIRRVIASLPDVAP